MPVLWLRLEVCLTGDSAAQIAFSHAKADMSTPQSHVTLHDLR